MNTASAHAAATGTGASLPPAGWPGDEDGNACYCPRRLLASFALLMSGHGRCVIIDMMLGDREYAVWQLACARDMDDAELAAIVRHLTAYFDDAQHTATPVRGTA